MEKYYKDLILLLFKLLHQRNQSSCRDDLINIGYVPDIDADDEMASCSVAEYNTAFNHDTLFSFIENASIKQMPIYGDDASGILVNLSNMNPHPFNMLSNNVYRSCSGRSSASSGSQKRLTDSQPRRSQTSLSQRGSFKTGYGNIATAKKPPLKGAFKMYNREHSDGSSAGDSEEDVNGKSQKGMENGDDDDIYVWKKSKNKSKKKQLPITKKTSSSSKHHVGGESLKHRGTSSKSTLKADSLQPSTSSTSASKAYVLGSKDIKKTATRAPVHELPTASKSTTTASRVNARPLLNPPINKVTSNPPAATSESPSNVVQKASKKMNVPGKLEKHANSVKEIEVHISPVIQAPTTTSLDTHSSHPIPFEVEQNNIVALEQPIVSQCTNTCRQETTLTINQPNMANNTYKEKHQPGNQVNISMDANSWNQNAGETSYPQNANEVSTGNQSDIPPFTPVPNFIIRRDHVGQSQKSRQTFSQHNPPVQRVSTDKIIPNNSQAQNSSANVGYVRDRFQQERDIAYNMGNPIAGTFSTEQEASDCGIPSNVRTYENQQHVNKIQQTNYASHASNAMYSMSSQNPSAFTELPYQKNQQSSFLQPPSNYSTLEVQHHLPPLPPGHNYARLIETPPLDEEYATIRDRPKSYQESSRLDDLQTPPLQPWTRPPPQQNYNAYSNLRPSSSTENSQSEQQISLQQSQFAEYSSSDNLSPFPINSQNNFPPSSTNQHFSPYDTTTYLNSPATGTSNPNSNQLRSLPHTPQAAMFSSPSYHQPHPPAAHNHNSQPSFNTSMHGNYQFPGNNAYDNSSNLQSTQNLTYAEQWQYMPQQQQPNQQADQTWSQYSPSPMMTTVMQQSSPMEPPQIATSIAYYHPHGGQPTANHEAIVPSQTSAKSSALRSRLTAPALRPPQMSPQHINNANNHSGPQIVNMYRNVVPQQGVFIIHPQNFVSHSPSNMQPPNQRFAAPYLNNMANQTTSTRSFMNYQNPETQNVGVPLVNSSGKTPTKKIRNQNPAARETAVINVTLQNKGVSSRGKRQLSSQTESTDLTRKRWRPNEERATGNDMQNNNFNATTINSSSYNSVAPYMNKSTTNVNETPNLNQSQNQTSSEYRVPILYQSNHIHSIYTSQSSNSPSTTAYFATQATGPTMHGGVNNVTMGNESAFHSKNFPSSSNYNSTESNRQPENIVNKASITQDSQPLHNDEAFDFDNFDLSYDLCNYQQPLPSQKNVETSAITKTCGNNDGSSSGIVMYNEVPNEKSGSSANYQQLTPVSDNGRTTETATWSSQKASQNNSIICEQQIVNSYGNVSINHTPMARSSTEMQTRHAEDTYADGANLLSENVSYHKSPISRNAVLTQEDYHQKSNVIADQIQPTQVVEQFESNQVTNSDNDTSITLTEPNMITDEINELSNFDNTNQSNFKNDDTISAHNENETLMLRPSTVSETVPTCSEDFNEDFNMTSNELSEKERTVISVQRESMEEIEADYEFVNVKKNKRKCKKVIQIPREERAKSKKFKVVTKKTPSKKRHKSTVVVEADPSHFGVSLTIPETQSFDVPSSSSRLKKHIGPGLHNPSIDNTTDAEIQNPNQSATLNKNTLLSTVAEEAIEDVEMPEHANDVNIYDKGIPPADDHMLQDFESGEVLEPEEVVIKLAKDASMNNIFSFVTFELVREEFGEALKKTAIAQVLERTIMTRFVTETIDARIAIMRQKGVIVVAITDCKFRIDTRFGRICMNSLIEHGILHFAVMLNYEVISQMNIPSVECDKNLKMKKWVAMKILTTFAVHFCTNRNENVWFGLLMTSMFMTKKRMQIWQKLSQKSICLASALSEFLDLTCRLLKITQLSVILFIHDQNEIVANEPFLEKVFNFAEKRVAELSPSTRSNLIFKFQKNIAEFLERHEKSDFKEEAVEFVSTLYWNLSVFGEFVSTKNRMKFLLHPLNPEVDRLLKLTLKEIEEAGTIPKTEWAYSMASGILRSGFMKEILTRTEKWEEVKKNALLAEIVPTLVKLVLSAPHLFVAADPYHNLELLPSVFEEVKPILNEAKNLLNADPIHVPFMPLAAMMISIKKHGSEDEVEPLLKACQKLYQQLRNAPVNADMKINAEIRRCSEEITYKKIHRQYVREQMQKVNLKKYQDDKDILDLKFLQYLVGKMFSFSSPNRPSKVRAQMNANNRTSIGGDFLTRDKLVENAFKVFDNMLNQISIQQKLEFVINHPLLLENINVADVITFDCYGSPLPDCFITFLGLLSQPLDNILGHTQPVTFFKSLKYRLNAVFMKALRNSVILRKKNSNHLLTLPEKDIEVYYILVNLLCNIDNTKVVRCSDSITTFIYLLLILNDVPSIDLQSIVEPLGLVCNVACFDESPISKDFTELLEKHAKIAMNKLVDTMIKDLTQRVNTAGVPRITCHSLSKNQRGILQLKCLILEIFVTFYNPHALLTGVSLVLPCRQKIASTIDELAQTIYTGIFHLPEAGVPIEMLQEMIVEEFNLIQGECFMAFEDSSFYGFIKFIQQLFNIESVIAATLIIMYIFNITGDRDFFGCRLTLAKKVAEEPKLLRFFGLQNSVLSSIGAVNENKLLERLEKLFEDDYVLHSSSNDPEILSLLLKKPFHQQYKELNFVLGTDCTLVRNLFPIQVENHLKAFISDEPKISQMPPMPTQLSKMPNNFKSKEVPASFCFFPQ